LALVLVLMAAHATLRLEDAYGATIVVTADALGLRVRALERHPRLDEVVELEVIGERLPVLTDMTEFALRGERVVGEHRTLAGPPPVPRYETVFLRDAGDDDVQQGGGREESASANVKAHGSHHQKLF
jgi:hypothetical protein